MILASVDPAAWIVGQHNAIQAAIGDGSPVSR
jgi:hypothetical protein